MEFKKLQTLAEGATRGSAGDIRAARTLFDSIESHLEAALKVAEGRNLNGIVERNGFPATETKAMITAIKKAIGEMEDAKMNIIASMEMEP